MSEPSQEQERYALSFTSGSLLSREAAVAAPLYLEARDWNTVRLRLQNDNLLQARTASSAARLSREVTQRLAVFRDEELEFLQDASLTERSQLMWVAACRRYGFIGDFAEEVVREKFLLMNPTLRHEDFESFVRSKSLWHPELSEVKPSTLQKLKTTLFRMLVEAGLLADGQIVETVLSLRLQDLLGGRTVDDVRFFPARNEGAVQE